MVPGEHRKVPFFEATGLLGFGVKLMEIDNNLFSRCLYFLNSILFFLTKNQGQVQGFVLGWNCSPNFQGDMLSFQYKNHLVNLSSLTTKKTCTGFAAFTNTWPVAISPLLTAGSFRWVGSYDLIIQLPNLFGSYLRQTCWGNHLKNHHIYTNIDV